MKKPNLFILPLAFVMLESSAHVLAQAQAQPELDITITVLEEGESPAGFIQQLELPPAEFFGNDEVTTTTAVDIDANDISAEVAGDAAADVSNAIDAATETVTNTVSETISIDGTAAAVAEPDLVPPAIVDVLDENLPLVDSLDDVLNETTEGLVDDVLPGVEGLPLVPGIGLPVLESGLVPATIEGVVDEELPLDAGAVEIVDNLGVEAENLLPELNDTTGELLNPTNGLDAGTATGTNLPAADMAPDTGALPEITSDPVDAVEDIVVENPEAPVADTLDDVTRNLPDLPR